MKINQRNNKDEKHGYWKTEGSQLHFFNNVRIGREIFLADDFMWKCHFINDKEIGCELLNNTCQYYFNKHGKKFGEEIEWE